MNTIDNRLKALNIIYQQQVSAEVEVFLGTENKWRSINPSEDIESHSQYLALYIVKRNTNDMVKVRLKTMRKIFQFLMRKKFVPEPRRLTWFEKLISK